MKYAVIITVLALGTMMSCNSSKDATAASESTENRSRDRGQRPGGEGRRDMEKMFTEMDANNDGRLAKLEVKGRLLENFDSIDTDGNGYISKEEMKNAPKPKRGNKKQRGQRGN